MTPVIPFKTITVRSVTRFGRKDYYPACDTAKLFVEKDSHCIRPYKIRQLKEQGWTVEDVTERKEP